MHFCPCLLSQSLNLMQHVLILEVYAADGGCARSQRSMVATPMHATDDRATSETLVLLDVFVAKAPYIA